MWDLPGPGLEPVSPALAGGFLTTAPPGRPPSMVFIYGICLGFIFCTQRSEDTVSSLRIELSGKNTGSVLFIIREGHRLRDLMNATGCFSTSCHSCPETALSTSIDWASIFVPILSMRETIFKALHLVGEKEINIICKHLSFWVFRKVFSPSHFRELYSTFLSSVNCQSLLPFTQRYGKSFSKMTFHVSITWPNLGSPLTDRSMVGPLINLDSWVLLLDF